MAHAVSRLSGCVTFNADLIEKRIEIRRDDIGSFATRYHVNCDDWPRRAATDVESYIFSAAVSAKDDEAFEIRLLMLPTFDCSCNRVG